jgi:hypothetical protein
MIMFGGGKKRKAADYDEKLQESGYSCALVEDDSVSAPYELPGEHNLQPLRSFGNSSLWPSNSKNSLMMDAPEVILSSFLSLYYYLLYASMVSYTMTGDLESDSNNLYAEYDKKRAVRYVNPVQLSEADGLTPSERKSLDKAYDETQDLWHQPLWLAGSAKGNGVCVRASVCHTTPDTLFLSFRPFNLENALEIVNYWELISYFKGYSGVRPLNADLTSDVKSVDNLLYQINQIASTEVDPETGISVGYTNLVAGTPLMIKTENRVKDKDCIPVRWPDSFDPNLNGRRSVSSLVEAISDFLSVNGDRFKKVIFCGFSMGSGCGLSSAILTHRLMVNKGVTPPKIHVVQFAGTMVGDSRANEYVGKNFESCIYFSLINTKEKGSDSYDPVSFYPHSREFKHAGDVFTMDYYTHRIVMNRGFLSAPFSVSQNTSPWLQLIVSYITGWNLGGNFKGFMNTHLPGEAMISRTLMYNIVQHWKSMNKRGRVDGNANVGSGRVKIPSWLAKVPCKFYTSSGTAAKYKVCPNTLCELVRNEVQVNNKLVQRSVCVSKV